MSLVSSNILYSLFLSFHVGILLKVCMILWRVATYYSAATIIIMTSSVQHTAWNYREFSSRKMMHMLCFILLNDKWLFLTKECSAVIQNKRPPKLAELAFYLKADMYRLSLSLLNVPTRPSGLYYRRFFFSPLWFYFWLHIYLNFRCLKDHTLQVGYSACSSGSTLAYLLFMERCSTKYKYFFRDKRP